jgi:hypothetical protein
MSKMLLIQLVFVQKDALWGQQLQQAMATDHLKQLLSQQI